MCSLAYRVSNDQLEALLNFLAKNPSLVKGAGLGPRPKEDVDKKWNILSRHLNAIGSGSSKSGKRWKRYWTDLKHKSKVRIRRWKHDSGGGGPSSQEDLCEIDKRILAIIGEQAVYGDTEHRIPDFDKQPEIPDDISTSLMPVENVLPDGVTGNVIVSVDTTNQNQTISINFTDALPISTKQELRDRAQQSSQPDITDAIPVSVKPELRGRTQQSSEPEVSPKSRPITERRRLKRGRPISPRINPQWVMDIEMSRAESEKKIADATTTIATAVHELVGVMRLQNILLSSLIEENRELRNRILK